MKPQHFLQTTKRFFEPALQNKPMLLQSFLYALRVGVFGLLNVRVFQRITQTIENKDTHAFFLALSVYAGALVIYVIGQYAMKYRHRVNRYRTDIKTMHRIYMQKFFELDNSEAEKFGTGKRISIIENGFHTRTDLIVHGIHIGTRILITFLYVSYVFRTTNYRYFIAFVVIFVGLHLFSAYINTFAIGHREQRIDTQNNYNAQLVKMIMSKFEITQSNKQKRELAILDTYSDQCTQSNRGENRYLFYIVNMPTLLIYGLKIFVCVTLGYTIITGQGQLAEFVGIIVLLGLLENVLTDSIDYYKEFTFNFATVEKLRKHFDTIKKNPGLTQGTDFQFKNGHIELRDVSFAYEETPVFQNFSLSLQGGTKTAFVGESGGGKTTLIKLIAGYIRADKGEILVDGQSISTNPLAPLTGGTQAVSLQSYYRHIGYLTQDPSVFDGTILENLLYGVAEETEVTERTETSGFSEHSELSEIITLSCCEFIYNLPQGLHTEIGERGVRLSGGQKQRLAIAKIMLKNPDIILLDEPTSALDSFNEELVSQALHNLFQNKTVIVVAHRLQTVKQADRILYIEGGKIIEDGSHTELVALGGRYKKMLDLQSGF